MDYTPRFKQPVTMERLLSCSKEELILGGLAGPLLTVKPEHLPEGHLYLQSTVD